MNNKKGISLIVLVITILVMIILAGVVIVSLQNDNPINKAKFAKTVDSIQSIRAAISQYAVTSQANETQGSTYDAKMKLILASDPGEAETGLLKLTADPQVKKLLGVDPSVLDGMGTMTITLKTGVSVFEITDLASAKSMGIKKNQVLPDGIKVSTSVNNGLPTE